MWQGIWIRGDDEGPQGHLGHIEHCESEPELGCQQAVVGSWQAQVLQQVNSYVPAISCTMPPMPIPMPMTTLGY